MAILGHYFQKTFMWFKTRRKPLKTSSVIVINLFFNVKRQETSVLTSRMSSSQATRIFLES